MTILLQQKKIMLWFLGLILVGCSADSKPQIQVRNAKVITAEGYTATDQSNKQQQSGLTVEEKNDLTVPDMPEQITTKENTTKIIDNSASKTTTTTKQITNENGQTTSVIKSSTVSKQNNEVVGNTQLVVKNSAVPNRDYTKIPKGTFDNEYYTVQRGDTLFYIAWISGNDFRTLAKRNNIPEPYNLRVGQVLDVRDGVNNQAYVAAGTTTSINPVAKSNTTTNKNQSSKSSTDVNSKKVLLGNKSESLETGTAKVAESDSGQKVGTVSNTVTTSKNTSSGISSNPESFRIAWHWPAAGKIIEGFSAESNGNKGIDISGTHGQPIYSAADGRVVYAGNALRGYGNLIIIKHNDDYLSAYAHNDAMLVSEQQEVKAGQKIATMGSSGASSVRLHFEVRYKGRSVNPLLYLPQR